MDNKHLEEQKVIPQQTSQAQMNSRLLFKLENQQFLRQQHNEGENVRSTTNGKFDSVFDTLRVLENKNNDRAIQFKWTKLQIKKSDLINKQVSQCQQCISNERILSSLGSGEINSHLAIQGGYQQNSRYPRTTQTRAGWMQAIKIPESNFVSGDDSSQGAIVLTNQLMLTAKKIYCVYVKGKIYRFESEQHETSQKVLNLKNCTMDMITIKRPDQTVAYEQGIQVKSLNKTYLFISQSRGDNNLKRKDIQDWFEYFKRYGILLNMKSYYEVGCLLGKGNFAKVYEATNFKTKEKYALKTIEKKMLSKNKRNFFALLQEVTLLRRLDHKNIIHLHEVYESENNIHLILEYLNGGELFERIKKNGSYNERDASIIMRCILEALVAMHKNQVVHRDLKPENLLFKDDDISSLKIVDFGLSALMKDGPLNMRCGSPGYVAPEILNDLGYGCKADIFSAGIILYILLTGKFVFSGKNYREILLKNKECLVPFPPQYWTNLTQDAKDLVKKMLEKDPKNRLTAEQALVHPWFTLNGTNLQSLKLNFEEVDEVVLTDEEPSLTNSVNLQLVTTSPIWNKTRMRDEVRKVNAEQDKRNTFQTPLPQPKFFAAKRQLEPNSGQQKVLKGVVVQNLYNQQQQNHSQIINLPQEQSLQQLKKQHQTPNINNDKKTSAQRVQNSTLSLLQQLFRKADQTEQNDKTTHNNDSKINESMREEQKQQDQSSCSVLNPSQEVSLNYNPNINQNSISGAINKSSQDLTQTSTPNQQPTGLSGLSKQQIDQNYERIMKKWMEPNYFAMSKILEDAALEDAKSFGLLLGSQLNPNDPNYEQIKQRALALRQFSVQQAQAKQLQFDQKRCNTQNQGGQSMHHQQIHDFLMKDIIPNQNNVHYDGPQPFFPGGVNQGLILPQSPNISSNSKYSPSQVKNSLPVIKEEGQLRQYLNNKNGVHKRNYDEDEESFGDLEIEENADGILEQNKIIDFNAHSNNCLLKSSTVDHRFNSDNVVVSSSEKISPTKQDVGNSSVNHLRPANPSSLSVNSNSFFMNSKQSNFLPGQSDSSGNKSQNQINDNSNSSNNQNISISNSCPFQLIHKQSIPKTLRKSQFWANSLNIQNEDDPQNEEANVEGQIDTEEQPINKIFYVPTTPGSIYGGSRNIMRHCINQGPLTKYLDNTVNNRCQSIQQPYNQLLTNPMAFSNKSSCQNQNSRPIELQQNLTFNNSQYFNRELNSKSNLSQGRLHNGSTHQQAAEEEIKEDQSFTDSINQQVFGGQSKTPINKGHKKEVQIFSLLRNEEKNQSNRSDSIKLGFNITPEIESSTDGLNKHLKKMDQTSNRIGMVGRRTVIANNGNTDLFNKSDVQGRESNLSGIPSAIRSSANASGIGDDKSGNDFQTAFQSMADLQDLNKQQNNSANNNLSWQGQHSSANENSQKSFHDIVNKGSNPQIYTEQNIQDQNMQNHGSELERQNNYSQELLKPQNSYNLGEFKNTRLTQVNNLRKALKNNI